MYGSSDSPLQASDTTPNSNPSSPHFHHPFQFQSSLPILQITGGPMEVDYLNDSSTNTQMDQMTVTMEMHKSSDLPEFQTTIQAPPVGYSADLLPEFRNAAAAASPTSVSAMREMIFRMAAMQPIRIDPEWVKPPKRRNVRISKDPQSVAARHRRERISERIRILQQLVPGGTKMDTASMLDEAIHYMKFLKSQVQSLEQAAAADRNAVDLSAMASVGMLYGSGNSSYFDQANEVQGFVANNL